MTNQRGEVLTVALVAFVVVVGLIGLGHAIEQFWFGDGGGTEVDGIAN